MSKIVNMRVTAHLTAPVAVKDYIRLDSLISCAIAKDILGDDFYKASNNKHESEETVIDTLSEVLVYNTDLHVFHASFGRFKDDREFQTCYSKRFNSQHSDLINFQGKGKQEIDTTRGQFKSYRNTLVYKSTDKLYFFARGNIGKVKQLLRNICYVGKKSSQGYGAISNWTVVEMEDDFSILDNNKRLMRNVPIDYLKAEDFDVNTAYVKKMAIIPPAYREEQYFCFCPK